MRSDPTSSRPARRPRRGFSLIELLMSLAIIALLVSILVPLLARAQVLSHRTLCMGNLRQIGVGWMQYLDDFDQFPKYTSAPDWNYGGVAFVGASRTPIVDEARPINPYVLDEADDGAAQIFRCPGDRGVWIDDGTGHRDGASVFSGRTCYDEFGTSYRANPFLLNSSILGLDEQPRPLRRAELHVSPSKLLLTADSVWYYATRPERDPDFGRDASWHLRRFAGNMLAADGSVRWVAFGDGTESSYALSPRPDLEDEAGARPLKRDLPPTLDLNPISK